MRDTNPVFAENELAAWRKGEPFYRYWRGPHGRRLWALIERRGEVTTVSVGEDLMAQDPVARVEADPLELAYRYASTLEGYRHTEQEVLRVQASGLVNEQEEVALHPCTPFDEIYKRSMAGPNYGTHASPLGDKDWVMPYISLYDPLDDEERHRIELAAFERGRRSVLGESDGDDE